MKVLVEIEFPDDFLVATLAPDERNRVIARRFQHALDHEYPYAPMGTVRIASIESHREGDAYEIPMRRERHVTGCTCTLDCGAPAWRK